MKTTQLLTSLVALATISLVPTVSAMLPQCFGMATDSATKVEYCISSDGAKTDKQKSVQLVTTIPGGEKSGVVSDTRTTTLHTGQSKTVGQTVELLTGVFEKFLAAPAPGTVLGKLGALEKGGEVEFVAASPDLLRFDFKSAAGVQTTVFSKADAMNYLALLKK